MPCYINEDFIVWNPIGAVKFRTYYPSNGRTKIHPKNKLINVPQYKGTSAFCLNLCLYFPYALNAIAHIFQQEAVHR